MTSRRAVLVTNTPIEAITTHITARLTNATYNFPAGYAVSSRKPGPQARASCQWEWTMRRLGLSANVTRKLSTLAMNATPAILFVCTANLCRSPIAMALFAQQAGKRDQGTAWRIESAGTWTIDGSSIPRRVQLAVEERHIDLRHHRARTVSRPLLQLFDLVLVMTADQREALGLEFPDIANKVCLLSEMAGYKHDIHDPIDGSLADIRAVAYEIAGLLNSGFEQIRYQVARRREQLLYSGCIYDACC